MRMTDTICENCDYYEPWDTESPIIMAFRRMDPFKTSWSLELNGSCRRRPPLIMPTDDDTNSVPGFPLFPPVSRAYWCGDGRWTDPETGERYDWGDWDE